MRLEKHKIFLSEDSFLKRIAVWIIVFFLFGSNQLKSQTPIALYNNFSGRVNYTVIGGTLRQQANPNSCTVKRSSTFRLTVPTGGVVQAAYLYWAGSYQSTPDYRVRLNNNVVTANRTFTVTFNNSGTLLPFFSGFADVTSLVLSIGNGNYTFDSLTVNIGSPHCDVQAVVSGWAMVVVYSRAAEIKRSINIYDGFDYFRGSMISFNPNNFYIPANQIEGRLTHITWEGDAENSASLNGYSENLYFNGSILSDATNPINNQFNSASSELGLTNTYGVDIDSYTLNAYLHAGDTTAISTYASGGDLVLLNCEVIAVADTSTSDISILKTHSGGASLTAGSNTTFTLSVANNGPDTTGTITVLDSLPAGATLLSVNAPGWTTDSSAKPKFRFLHSGTHPPGVNIPNINLNVLLNQQNYPKLYNTSTVSSVLMDRKYWNNSSTDSITILTPLLDNSTKFMSDLNAGNVIPGDTLQFTIRIKNSGNYAAPNVNVIDTIPSGLNIILASLIPSGSINNNVITFNSISSIAINDSFDVRYKVVVDSSIIGNQTAINIAHIKTMTIDKVVSSSFVPVNAAALSLNKSSVTKKYYPRDTISYTLTYTNHSTKTISTGTQIFDTIPSYLTFVSGSASNGGAWDPNPTPRGRVVWNLGSISPQTQSSVTFKVVISNPIPVGTVIINSARLFNSQGSSAFGTKSDTVHSGTTGTLIATPNQIIAGDSVSFLLTDADLNRVESIAESYVYETISSKGEIENCTFTETGLNTGIFIAGIRTIYGTSSGTNNDGIYVVAPGDSIFATYLDSLTAGGDSARINIFVRVVAPDYSLSSKLFIDLNGGSIIARDTVHYIIKVNNSSIIPAYNIAVTDTLPSGVNVIPGSISNGGILSGSLVTFPNFSLAANDSLSLTFNCIIDSTIPDNSTVENIALISGGGGSKTVSVSFTVSNKPAMTMIKNVTSSIVSIGDTVEYTISYTNIGTGIAANIIVTDTIPAQTIYIQQSVILNGISKTDQSDSDEVSCDGILVRVSLQQNLQPGNAGTFKYRVRIK